MPYDDANYRTKHMLGPIFGSLASAALKLTASATNKTATSANLTDRLEFFKNIKLTGCKAITRAAAALLTGATNSNAPKVLVFDGTSVVASCRVGTAAGLTTDGGVSATPNIDSSDTISLKFKATGDGTAATFDSASVDVYLEYQYRI